MQHQKEGMSEQLAVNLNVSQYDFLDFGASYGGSIEFARRRLGGIRGVGVDKNPRKVAAMRRKGYDCILGDITALDLPPASVRFVVMSHILEHLPDLHAVQQSIACAGRVATDFLFLQGPFFDADNFLRNYGLKFYWSDWRGHPCHLTTQQLREILSRLGLPNYFIMGRRPVSDSSDTALHPLHSPRDQHDYQPGVHPPKPFVQFPQPLYKEFVCYVRLRDVPDWATILNARRECYVLETTPSCSLASETGRHSPANEFRKNLEDSIVRRVASRLRELAPFVSKFWSKGR